jgi:peptidoglycan/LPS O-acetylase OafA/YrhL
LAFVQALFHIRIYHRELDVHYVASWLLWHAFMMQNLSTNYVVAIDAPLWSLALEFQLYVFFPLLVEAFRRFNKLGVLLLVFIATSVYRAAVPEHLAALDPLYTFILPDAVFGRLFEFSVGMYVAHKVANWYQGDKMPFRIGDYMLAVSVVSLGFWNFDIFGDASLGVILALVVLAASRSERSFSRLFSNPTLARIGIFSYSVYLVHQPILMGIGGKVANDHLSNVINWALVLFAVIPLLIGIGYVFHLFFEKPFISTRSALKHAVPADTLMGNVNAHSIASTLTD